MQVFSATDIRDNSARLDAPYSEDGPGEDVFERRLLLRRGRLPVFEKARSPVKWVRLTAGVGPPLNGSSKHGRQTENKAIVVVAIEMMKPKGFGHLRLRQVPNVSGESLVPFICDVVKPGSVVMTDGWGGYNTVSGKGYQHERTVLSSSGDPAHVAMPGVHRIAALLKRWLLGTHQGAVSAEHLDYYLDEYTFRFNRRTSRSRGMLFYRLLEQAVATEPAPYRAMVGGKAF